jgi:hypothetical protein
MKLVVVHFHGKAFILNGKLLLTCLHAPGKLQTKCWGGAAAE